MKYLYALGGATTPLIKEYEIDPKTVIEKGDIIYQSASGVINNEQIGAAMGIAHETHTATEDPLNPRNNGNRLMINITQGGVYQAEAPRATATKTCTSTTFVCNSQQAHDYLQNARLVLVKKAENSENTDSVGDVRVVKSISMESGSATFTLTEGGVPYTGDEYAILPDYGFVGEVGKKGKTFSLGSVGSGHLKVVDFDTDTCTLEVTLTNGFFNI